MEIKTNGANEMNTVTFNSRPVIIEEVSHSSDYVDSYVMKAYYLDTEVELSDSELDQLTGEVDMYGIWFENVIDSANFYNYH